jgi:hypothetical protein
MHWQFERKGLVLDALLEEFFSCSSLFVALLKSDLPIQKFTGNTRNQIDLD